MALLSKPTIIRRIRENELAISPILSEAQIGPCSVDVRLGNSAFLVRARGLSHVEPRNYIEADHQTEKGRRQKLERHDIPFGQMLLLHPGMLTLVPTLEWIRMPRNLQGVVTARSSWAREGLNIATASFINPGYIGAITMELSNFGQIPIGIYPGMRIAQIALYELDAPVSDKHIGTSQFHIAFEPESGDITKGDEKFVTPSKSS